MTYQQRMYCDIKDYNSGILKGLCYHDGKPKPAYPGRLWAYRWALLAPPEPDSTGHPINKACLSTLL